MKRFLPYAAASVLLSSCSIMGPAFTGLLSDPAPVGVSTPVGVSSQAGRRYTPAEDPATGLYGYLDHYGRWAIAPQFRRASAFNRNLAVVQVSDGRWGAIDLRGAMVVQPRFNSASDARAAVQRLNR